MTHNIFKQTINTIVHAADLMELPDRLKKILSHCKNEIIVNFPVRMDDGSYRIFAGFRAQHNNVLGPYKGGIRFHPTTVELDHIKGLAAIMTIKTALSQLPFGGAKGGVIVDPRTLSADELMRLSRRFVSALGDNIGPNTDIPAPDMGTNSQVMAWMADTYMNTREGEHRFGGLGVVTGKPVAFGGSPGREKATGHGVALVLENMLPDMKIPLNKMSFTVAGFGNVGSWAARLLHAKGAKLTAVLGRAGALMNEKGLDPNKLTSHILDEKPLAQFDQGEWITADQFFSLPVDVFIPAAIEQMITMEVAKKLKCKLIAEAANAPLTPEAKDFLLKDGMTILPDVLCNAGGVIVSYFEWKQNRQAETWSESDVDRKLMEKMSDATARLKETAKRRKLDYHTAAYCAALEHIHQVYSIRGIFP